MNERVTLQDINRSEISSMDSDRSAIKGNPAQFYGNAFVCFMDLLGFSRALLSDWGDGPESPLSRLLRIKRNPEVSAAEALPAFSIYYDGPVGEMIRPFGTYQPRVCTVSDSITVSVALPERIQFGDFCLGYRCSYLESGTSGMRQLKKVLPCAGRSRLGGSIGTNPRSSDRPSRSRITSNRK